ncbi:MAG: DUF971 domain-containing protein [Gammaproteobacteria bacterium]|nr:DUF971 domain-containing protein [Gammaproteobacteria bacterium]MBU1653590.1 DUF971 domain-containing protein [Gammaproteobacteria bacterium]MBU1962371.1 DUF971 domain-containing protein [Gammaproteobacteria bacterium]
MNDKEHLIPTEINLHRKSRLLTVAFSDGRRFELPCEYLRVNSPAADVKALGHPVTGKETVNIESIEPQGHYALRLVFDDGHDTGIYAWETLYNLGVNQESNWNRYLDQLKAIGYERESIQATGDKPLELKILYFSYLVQKLFKESEQVRVPPKVADIKGLLEWLRRKWSERGYLLADDRVRVTVNRQFAEPFTRLEDGDEIGIAPNSPNPPPPPK